MRQLDYQFDVARELEGIVCQPQITQVWHAHNLLVTILCEENTAAVITPTTCSVDHAIHLGYMVQLPEVVPCSESLFRLTFNLTGLRKVRHYDIVLDVRKPAT